MNISVHTPELCSNHLGFPPPNFSDRPAMNDVKYQKEKFADLLQPLASCTSVAEFADADVNAEDCRGNIKITIVVEIGFEEIVHRYLALGRQA